MKPRPCDATQETKVLQSAALTDAGAPQRVMLAPWGRVESANGDFIVDDESVAAALAAFVEQGTDLPIDYEHQTLGGSYASPTGQAPAAGWIKRLHGEPGVGLFADIEWTEQGRGLVASKQYRYVSPVAVVRKADRKLVAVHSAALTNKPAIVGMTPLVHAIHVPVADGDSPLEVLRCELGLASGAEPEELLIAAGQRLAQLRESERRRRIDERISAALRAGKLVEAQRAWAEEAAGRDERLFDEWLRTAPVLVPLGVTTAPQSTAAESRRQATVSRARAEFRASPLLAALTSEEAYVADAVRNSE